MAIVLPHIEDSHSTNYLPPKGNIERFRDETHYAEKVKEWGLGATKKEFWFKNRTHQRLVTIVGYETYGDTLENNTLVIKFQDGNLTCIHPAYLKEMQSSSFGKEVKTLSETTESPTSIKETLSEETDKTEETLDIAKVAVSVKMEDTSISEPKEPKAKTPKAKKEKPAKLVLPEEKVHFSAKVKQFALSWNHFNEENDEVVVLEDIKIVQEEPIEVGLAWCAHSKTLKKFELSPGDLLEFDGKIVKKSLPKGKDVEDESLLLEVSVPYKVNNPSKLVKK